MFAVAEFKNVYEFEEVKVLLIPKELKVPAIVTDVLLNCLIVPVKEPLTELVLKNTLLSTEIKLSELEAKSCIK